MFIVVLGGILIYKNFHPMDYALFPKCPLKATTGIECPGCGSQRALHYLFNLDFVHAFKMNPLLVLFLPYLFFGYFLEIKKPRSKRLFQLRHIFYGRQAMYVILGIVLLFWLLRNIL